MSNVVSLSAHRRARPTPDRLVRHMNCFAHHRRQQDDVFWLKENAELLNILQATDTSVPENGIALYTDIYRDLPNLIGFFPQYYRFWLSICLDLEDLGMDGQIGEALCDWVIDQGLVEAELSDLQRAEAERLLRRRMPGRTDAQLRARLVRFAARPETFAIPNKKACYELTHIVFYLSDYGRIDPELPAGVDVALEYAGLMAAMEHNFDLLAEVCIARRYAGFQERANWSAIVTKALDNVTCGSAPSGPQVDDYHWYFVSNWHAAQLQRSVFLGEPGTQGAWFSAPEPGTRLLGHLSAELRRPAMARAEDWGACQRYLETRLPEQEFAHLKELAAYSDHFETFFSVFARTNRPRARVLTKAI